MSAYQDPFMRLASGFINNAPSAAGGVAAATSPTARQRLGGFMDRVGAGTMTGADYMAGANFLQGFGQGIAGGLNAANFGLNADQERMFGEYNAQQIELAAQRDVKRRERAGKIQIGRVRAAYGAAGVSLSSGSPGEVIHAEQFAIDRDIADIEYDADAAAFATRFGAELRATNYEQQAQASLLGGAVSMATSLVTGMAYI